MQGYSPEQRLGSHQRAQEPRQRTLSQKELDCVNAFFFARIAAFETTLKAVEMDEQSNASIRQRLAAERKGGLRGVVQTIGAWFKYGDMVWFDAQVPQTEDLTCDLVRYRSAAEEVRQGKTEQAEQLLYDEIDRARSMLTSPPVRLEGSMINHFSLRSEALDIALGVVEALRNIVPPIEARLLYREFAALERENISNGWLSYKEPSFFTDTHFPTDYFPRE